MELGGVCDVGGQGWIATPVCYLVSETLNLCLTERSGAMHSSPDPNFGCISFLKLFISLQKPKIAEHLLLI